MFRRTVVRFRQKVGEWIKQGISPRRLALTLALGFAIGCFPVFGVTTFLCALLALMLRLNLPAIQAANYIAMPFQVALIVPFVRLGGWLFSSGPRVQINTAMLLHNSPWKMLTQMGRMAELALGAWLLIAIPTVLALTAILTPLLRHIPALSEARACD